MLGFVKMRWLMYPLCSDVFASNRRDLDRERLTAEGKDTDLMDCPSNRVQLSPPLSR